MSNEPTPPTQPQTNSGNASAALKNMLLLVIISFFLMAMLLTGLVGWWFYKGFVNPPQPTPVTQIINRGAVLEAIRSVNKQVFIEHDAMVPVVYTEVPEGWIGALGLKQEMVVLIRGTAPAGFDLNQMREADIWVSSDGKRVQVVLPPPVIFEENVSINFADSEIIAETDLCPDLICTSDLSAYQDAIMPNAQQMIIDAADTHGILPQAATDGQKFYEQLLKSLGFEEIRVIVDGYDAP